MKEIIVAYDENAEASPVMGDWVGELVRCKDCKHGKQLFDDYISCQISEENESGCHLSHKPDWFCADGERNPTQTNTKNETLDVR